MKLPDKVYLNKFMIRPGMLHPAEFPPDNPEEEYIRKEALLEWAKECTDSFNEQMKDLKQTDIAYRVICGGLSTIELLLNKLNEI